MISERLYEVGMRTETIRIQYYALDFALAFIDMRLRPAEQRRLAVAARADQSDVRRGIVPSPKSSSASMITAFSRSRPANTGGVIPAPGANFGFGPAVMLGSGIVAVLGLAIPIWRTARPTGCVTGADFNADGGKRSVPRLI